jgi:hypothetical protein
MVWIPACAGMTTFYMFIKIDPAYSKENLSLLVFPSNLVFCKNRVYMIPGRAD